jgi:hypothetical protein
LFDLPEMRNARSNLTIPLSQIKIDTETFQREFMNLRSYPDCDFFFHLSMSTNTLKTLPLSSTAMKNLVKQGNEYAFDWIVGSSRFRSTWMCAEVWSPKIAKLRATDPSIAEYVVETPDPNNQFESFLEISEGGESRVDESNLDFLLSLFREFQNWGQCRTLRAAFGQELAISKDESLPLELLDAECEEGIKTLASKFWKLTREQFCQIPLTTLSLVLDHESLKISSEDLLYQFISGEIPTNRDYFQMLRFIKFTRLSGASIVHFNALTEDYFDLINLDLWKMIGQRLGLPVGYNCTRSHHTKHIYCPLDERERPDGIIAYLSRGMEDCPGRALLEITTRSVANDQDPEITAAWIAHGNEFTSKDEADQWVCLQLSHRRVRPTHYSFYSTAKSWILEGSQDGTNWTEIDRRTDIDWPEDKSRQSFNVSRSEECKFLRLAQTDKNTEGTDTLHFDCFEIFGHCWNPGTA